MIVRLRHAACAAASSSSNGAFPDAHFRLQTLRNAFKLSGAWMDRLHGELLKLVGIYTQFCSKDDEDDGIDVEDGNNILLSTTIILNVILN